MGEDSGRKLMARAGDDSYGLARTLGAGDVDVALGWLSLPKDHEARLEVEVLIAEGKGWGAIRRYFTEREPPDEG